MCIRDRLMWELTLKYHENEKQARDYQKLIADLDLILIKLEPIKIIAMDFSKN